FLLSVSHELKTPLTAIRGYAEGLREGVLPAEEAAATIVRESQRLERLVGDVLDLARMRKAEFSVRRERIDLRAIALEALRRYAGQAKSFGVSLDVEGATAAPALGDADRTLQIVSNLVENALRLAPAGGSVRIRAAPGELQVEDTGPGLRPEELERAFERFYLYSRYGRERAVGTGLGLAIVKELAEGMDGSVAARSAPGRLTVFTLRLPLAATPGASREESELTRA
ncbi:MAG: HAMP domain-containing histidine kinase, partial [Actinobacteria bacterium]|nr:HAMP domain-containing histidine kinase [Actinomycetota bacterium]